MTYIILGDFAEYQKYIWTSISSPYKILITPPLHDSIMRRVAHLLWRFGILIKWNLFNKEFYKQIKKITKNDHVIFQATYLEPVLNISTYLPRNVDKHIWFWDSLDVLPENNEKMIKLYKRDNFKIHSFDPEDSKKYQLHFVPTFYNMSDFEANGTNKDLYDFYFMGGVKPGRKEKIDSLYQTLEKDGYRCKFLFINKSKSYISYSKNIEFIKQSKCLIELNQDNQNGLTLRAMEALKYRKKLITTNQSIVNYSFYHKDNIFVLGIDDWSEIGSFIQTQYRPIPEEIVKEYDINSWLSKIIS